MTAYICTPYRAVTNKQFESQLQYTKEIAREAVIADGYNVIVPHLYYPQFLNDGNEVERNIGLSSALNLIDVCNIVIVGEKYGISQGMEAEIEYANANGIKIKRV